MTNLSFCLQIGRMMYQCGGMVVHQGDSCKGGHYYAYVKTAGEWYKANDSKVIQF